ncbi:MAG: tRNA epoxyqueuosine(34) reductase QueG [bacterium]|nr:tRNA epoxyqueuosine(34) reductase QueG [bacterium]
MCGRFDQGGACEPGDIDQLRAAILAVGFDRVGFASADESPDFERYLAWLAAGNAADMTYLAEHRNVRRSAREILPEAQSVILVSLGYHHPADDTNPTPGTGVVSRYARGRDYHKVLGGRLRQAAVMLRERFGAKHTRICVDTAPLLERSLAARAGLGWIGRNKMLIERELGSWTFLGALLTDLRLPEDAPVANRCGTCRACLDACPSGALTEDAAGGTNLDARSCFSYLTIESDNEIGPAESRQMEDRIFGCDLCQEACPWNRQVPATEVADFKPRPGQSRPELSGFLRADRAWFLKRFAGTPLMRAGVDRMARNARICQKNSPPSASDCDAEGGE